MADNKENLFVRLSKLFRSGPTVRRKVKNYKPTTLGTSVQSFGHGANSVYNAALSAYGTFDRMSRYSDFSEMEATPEIASALDIYAEESTATDEKGETLHVYSDNRKIQEILDNLFYDVLNIEFNLTMWTRNLCKYGDFFLFIDVDPQYGIVNAFPIPIAEMEREEGFDPEDMAAVRFRWITQGNKTLENWQVIHFRLLGSDAFLPYGSSVLESARRIWRQLILIEDAMLVYRVIRAPERRVFYIDVGGVSPEDVAPYMAQVQDTLKRNKVVDKNTGRVDLRYNPLSVDEDYFLPVRGGESGTKIDTLAGGTNAAAIEDVEYIQKKLFAALKIPRAYLGYDEEIGSKATLAQEDIRFSRSIQRIQKTIISELNKMAIIHLYAHGFSGEDLLDFDLKLSNPSSIAQQQKLELIRSRFEIAGQAPEGIVDRNWVRKNVVGLTALDIERIEKGREEDRIRDLEIEEISLDSPGAEEEMADQLASEELPPKEEEEEDLFASDDHNNNSEPSSSEIRLLTSTDKNSHGSTEYSISDEDAPIKAQSKIMNIFNEPIQKSRKSTGPIKTSMPNFASIAGIGKSTRIQDTSNDPFDKQSFRNLSKEGKESFEDFFETKIKQQANMTNEISNILNEFSKSIIINESQDSETELKGEE